MSFFGWFGRNKKETPVISEGVQDSANDTMQHQSVTFDSALSQSAYFACIRLLTDTISSMPLACYETDGKVRKPKNDYALHSLLNYKPNRYQNRIEFISSLVLNLVTSGNAFARIDKDSRGRIYSVLPINTSQMTVELLPTGDLKYTEILPDRTEREHLEKDIMHIKIFGGLVGESPLSHMSRSLATSKALSSRQYELATTADQPRGVFKVDEVLNESRRSHFHKSVRNPRNKNIILLEANMDFESTALSPSDQQLIESLQLSTEDTCRFLGVPGTLVNQTNKSSSWASSTTALFEGFLKLTLAPIMEKIEMGVKINLMERKDWKKIEIELDESNLLRMDAKTRAEINSIKINSGQASPNECRLYEGLPAMPGGDDLLVNGSLKLAKNLNNSQSGSE